jgi:hypothetical protein
MEENEPMNLEPLSHFAKSSLRGLNSNKMLSKLTNNKGNILKILLGSGATIAAGITAKKLYDYNKARTLLHPDELKKQYPKISRILEPIYTKLGKPLPTPPPAQLSLWQRLKGYFSKPATPQTGGRKRRIVKKKTSKKSPVKRKTVKKTKVGGSKKKVVKRRKPLRRKVKSRSRK